MVSADDLVRSARMPGEDDERLLIHTQLLEDVWGDSDSAGAFRAGALADKQDIVGGLAELDIESAEALVDVPKDRVSSNQLIGV